MRRLAVAAGGCLVAAVGLRVPALAMPLDRDTALYAAIGQRIGFDRLPYRDFFDHKQPLIHWVYALLDLLAPGSLAGIRLAAAVPSALVAAGLFVFLERVAGARRAVAAAGLVVLLSASTTLQGTDLNTEHLLTLPAAATALWALSLDRPGMRGGPFAIGLVGGVAILAKASAGPIVLAALIPLLTARGSRGQSALATIVRFGAGLVLPLAVVVTGYEAAGALDDFVFANWTYNSRYVGQYGFTLRPLGPEAVQLLFGAALCWGVVRLSSVSGRDVLTWTLLAWLLGAWLGAQASSRGYAHYYAPVVAPAVALLVLPPRPVSRALGLARGAALAVGALAVVLIAVPVAGNFGRSGDEISADVYGPEELELWKPADVVGSFLRRRDPRADLFVVGSEPQYYWRSGLRAANRWLFDYPVGVAPERFLPEVAGLCVDGPRFVVIAARVMPAYARHCTARSGYSEILRRGPITVLEHVPAQAGLSASPPGRRARG
ncbi:MAG: glycosyltransferase family 39 protein [Solirubrobacteraceae bacterium]